MCFYSGAIEKTKKQVGAKAKSKPETEVVLQLSNVSKTFLLSENKTDSIKQKLFNLFSHGNSSREFNALRNINLQIHKGETIGLIGRNGSGKTTLTKIMSGSYLPDKGGRVERKGTTMLMNLGVGMSHELTAIQNIYISGSVLGLKKSLLQQKISQILKFAELEEFADTKIKYYSSGMIQRLSFSIAVNAGADILFLDEVFAVGDIKFKQKAIEVFEKSWIEGRTVLMVTHSLGNIEKYCNRCIYLKKGELQYFGDPKTAIEMYKGDID